MISGIDSSLSALDSLTRKAESTANNVANVNTPGYKASRVTLQDVGGSAIATASGADQLGRGVTVSNVARSQDQGGLEATPRPTDFGISGQGYFVLREPAAGAADLYSRVGNFQYDQEGYLISPGGALVQGWQLEATSGERQGSIGDIRIPQTMMTTSPDQEEGTTAHLQGVATDGRGVITASYSDGLEVQVAQVALATFNNPEGLRSDGGGIFRPSTTSGPASTGAPGTAGLGGLLPNALEGSNVDLTRELTTMLITQAGFKANVKMIQAGDEMIGSLLDIKT
ncbi:MAG: hypothetical protein C0613_13835 [Desulfobulbaceae bacterium]|nr:MAG: hypothetical protein C0613_13835 [Desulfobulbaceae bacterium]